MVVQAHDKEDIMTPISTKRIPYMDAAHSHKPKDAVLRFFSKKHAMRYSYGQLPAAKRTVLEHTIITQDGRLAFIKNSKAGCTTVAHLLYRYDHKREFEGNIHHTPTQIRLHDWQNRIKALEQAVSFSTVRNPERRAVSAFFDFFVNQRNAEAQKHINRIDAYGFSHKEDITYKFDVFLDYVEDSIERSPLQTDRHFRPQHINLGHGAFDLTCVARVETLDADLERIGELAQVTLPPPSSLPDQRKNKSGSEVFAPTQAQRCRVEKIYAKDLELYGY